MRRGFVLLAASILSVQAFPVNDRCRIPQFQEEELAKLMMEKADEMALKAATMTSSEKVFSRRVLNFTYADEDEARAAISAAVRAHYPVGVDTESMTTMIVLANHMTRMSYQEYRLLCNLPKNNELEKAMTQLAAESLEEPYSKASRSERWEIVKIIIKESGVFAESTELTTELRSTLVFRCQLPQYQEEEVAKKLKRIADEVAGSEITEYRRKTYLVVVNNINDDAEEQINAYFKKINQEAEAKGERVYSQFSINRLIDNIRKLRKAFQKYKSLCKLPKTNGFEKAVSDVYREAVEETYRNATDVERMEIVKRILEKNQVFATEETNSTEASRIVEENAVSTFNATEATDRNREKRQIGEDNEGLATFRALVKTLSF